MSEYTWYDADQNGTYEIGVADLDGDGWDDTSAHDLNGDLVIDTYMEDTDRDGVIGDTVYVDANQDGVTDALSHDYDENSVVDAVSTPQTGWQPQAVEQQTGFSPTIWQSAPAYGDTSDSGVFTTTWQSAPAYGDTAVPGESVQIGLTRLLENETDPIKQASLFNAITMMNVNDMNNPWLD